MLCITNFHVVAEVVSAYKTVGGVSNYSRVFQCCMFMKAAATEVSAFWPVAFKLMNDESFNIPRKSA